MLPFSITNMILVQNFRFCFNHNYTVTMCRYKNNVLPVDSDRYPVLVPQWLTLVFHPGHALRPASYSIVCLRRVSTLIY